MKIKKTIDKIVSLLKKLSAKKKLAFVAVILVLSGAIIGSSILFNNKNSTEVVEQEPHTKNTPTEERKVAGGDPQLVISYHQQSVAAWKAGDKEKAKHLAQEGLNLNDQLTTDQQAQIPQQGDIVYEMYDIAQDLYDDN